MMKFLLLIPLVVLVLISGSCYIPSQAPDQVPLSAARWFSPDAFINTPLPADAVYTLQADIGVVRQVYGEWSMPIYRLPAGETLAPVTITNNYRTCEWPIPRYAAPAAAADHHLCVADESTGTIYEMWDAHWAISGNRIVCGALNSYPLTGNAQADKANQGVCAASFAVSAGMIVLEDFIDPQTGLPDPDRYIDHAMTMAVNGRILEQSGYTPPARRGEDDYGDGNIPCGALFALPPELEMAALSDFHPLVQSICFALKTYGVYVNDGNSAEPYREKEVGTIRIEPGLCEELYGKTCDDLIDTVTAEMFAIISEYNLYRVSGIY